MTSTWQGPKKNTEPFLTVNKGDSEKDNHLMATKNMTTRLTLKQVGGSTKGRGGKPADNFVIVVNVGPNPLAAFGCLEKNLQPTDGRCEHYTHKYSAYRVAQHDHISSREHAWLKSRKAQGCTSLCP